MPGPRGYQPFCPLGAALNAVGDRWALLIVRDLMLGPRRFSELATGLGGVGTDILTARLRSLEDAGVICRGGQGRAAYYELTSSGRQLQPALLELARWGAGRLQLPDDPAAVPARVILTALLLDAGPLPQNVTGCFELRAAGEHAVFEVASGAVTLDAAGPPDATITLDPGGLRALAIGASAAQLEANHQVSVNGERKAAHKLLDAISGPRLFQAFRQLGTMSADQPPESHVNDKSKRSA
jgi:DNA-binding HxlR family transcriptional regulator